MKTELNNALESFHKMEEKDVNEVAYTYLLGVLEADLPEDIRARWKENFTDDSLRESLEKEFAVIKNSEEGKKLLIICLENTLAERPETEILFIDAVNGVGKKMWAVETAIVTIAAATLLREYFMKGRQKTVTVKHWKKVNGEWVYEETETIEFATDYKGIGRILIDLAKNVIPL